MDVPFNDGFVAVISGALGGVVSIVTLFVAAAATFPVLSRANRL